MKSSASDPWRGTRAETTVDNDDSPSDRFEDSFLDENTTHRRLSDSEQYLQKLYSRLKVLQGGNTRKDLVASLSVAKEDCIARLITSSGNNPQSEEEAELASNPLIRHVAPHLQMIQQLKHNLNNPNTTDGNNRTHTTFYQILTEASQEMNFTDKDFHDNIMTMLLTASDTISTVINFVTFVLANFSEIQALTASELVHLLKADVLQVTTQADREQNTAEELQTSQPLTEPRVEHNN